MTDLLSQSIRLPDGQTLTYAEYGVPDGKPVFYFHGLAGSRLEEIRFLVRLLPGEADLNVPVAAARKVAAAIPGCQATFYPGEGHFSTVVNHLDEVFIALA